MFEDKFFKLNYKSWLKKRAKAIKSKENIFHYAFF